MTTSPAVATGVPTGIGLELAGRRTAYGYAA